MLRFSRVSQKAAVIGRKSQRFMDLEAKFSAHNYKPSPCVFSNAKGVHVYDPEGKKYIDFMSGYGSVNQGHRHPKIIKAATEQLGRVTLSCRAYYNDRYPVFAQRITKLFGYDKVLPMNTGAEAVETAVKIAKKWSYRVKGVPTNQAKIICMSGNFHGRTHLCISLSDDPDSFSGYEPLLPGIIRVPYGDSKALAAALAKHGATTAAVIAEPVQGEAGVVFPPDGFLRDIRRLTKKHNVLWIDDEIQAGLGRTGYLMATEHEGVRPDIVIFAKALGGGVLPVSCALADNEVMDVITPGTHGSTFGGNPMAAHIADAALEVLVKEKLSQKSRAMGKVMTRELKVLKGNFPDTIDQVRSRGLWGAVQFYDAQVAAYSMKNALHAGLLVKTTHDLTLRLAPPLIINEAQMKAAFKILGSAVAEAQAMVAAKKSQK